MKINLAPNFFLVIVVLILGGALLEQFDFQNLTFEKPALAVVYGIVLIFSIVFMIKTSKNK